MATWTIEYTYDERADARDLHRPAHLEYLRALADQGEMLAYGRYDDEGAPGALLVCEVKNQDAVEAIILGDPFVAAGLVPAHQIRRWPANWGRALTDRIER